MSTKFHFFTDTNLLSSQLSSAFGPAGTDGAGNDRYRISSMHSASSNPAAYAICNGIVCVQEVPNTSLVNLILKPMDPFPINFVPVRYYIYKGIRRDSLFSGAAIAAASVTNQLTTAIWDSQNARNDSAGTPNVSAPAEALGIDLTDAHPSGRYGNDKPIDNLFYRTGVDAQFPHVNGGWKIGTFDKTLFGFEILLDGLGYSQELALARSLENYILVTTLTSSSPADVFAHWHEKEKVLGFMDPCAFFGSFHGAGVRAKTSAGTFELKQEAPLNKLYKDVVSLFLNKNRVYVDIRNEHNNSFNYFNNYDRSIQVAFTAAPGLLSPIGYYDTGWPILIIEETPTQQSPFPASNPKLFNSLRVTLPVGDNLQPLLYLSQGYKSKDNKPFSSELSYAARVIQGNEVALALPNVASSTSAHPASCYVRLKYFKRNDTSLSGTPASLTTVVASNYRDNIFYPVELRTKLDGNWNIKSTIYEEEIYVDARTELGVEFIGKIGFAVDDYNVTLFTFPLFVIGSPDANPFSIIGKAFKVVNLDDTFLTLLLAGFPSIEIERKQIVLTSPSGNVDTVSLIQKTPKQEKDKSPIFSQFIALVIDNTTYQNLVTLAGNASTFLPGYRVFLGIKDDVTPPGASYTTNELVLRGYAPNASDIKVIEMNTGTGTTNVMVYST
jgi:hypothetical protein